MGRAVVTAANCAAAINESPETAGLTAADSAADYVQAVDALLATPARAVEFGERAQRHVRSQFSWPAQLAAIDHHLARLNALPSKLN